MPEYFKTFKECFDIMLEQSRARGFVSQVEGYLERVRKGISHENVILVMMSAFSWMDSLLFAAIQRVADNLDRDLAEDSDLDNLGKLISIDRPRSSHTHVILTFSYDGVVDDVLKLPKGLIVTSDNNDVDFVTQEDVVFIKDGSKEVDVLAISQGKGASQRVEANTLDKIIGLNGIGVTVINKFGSYGGLDPADDEEYREFMKNWQRIHQRGNLWAYHNYLRNYDGLRAYKLIPKWDGPGTMKIIIDCAKGLEQYHQNKIYNDLFTVGFADDDVIIQRSPAFELKSAVHIKIITSSQDYTAELKDKVIDQVKHLVNIFIEGGKIRDNYHEGLSIGDDFIPFKLAVFINENIGIEYDIEEVKILSPDGIIRVGPYAVLKLNSVIVEVE